MQQSPQKKKKKGTIISYFPFMISFLFEIYPIWVSSMLLRNLFVVEWILEQ